MNTNSPYWEIRIIGQRGRIAAYKRGNISFNEDTKRAIRAYMAAYWATVKKSLTVGQSATITLNGRITRTFNA